MKPIILLGLATIQILLPVEPMIIKDEIGKVKTVTVLEAKIKPHEHKKQKPAVKLVEPSRTRVSPVPVPNSSIEQIVRQAARKHGIDGDYFVRIARCESGLNPNSVNRNYYDNGHPSGLFQHISGYWPARAKTYGYTGRSVFDPEANANVTAAMFADGLSHLWECK